MVKGGTHSITTVRPFPSAVNVTSGLPLSRHVLKYETIAVAIPCGAEGYEVTTAGDGFDALLHLQDEMPDLLLSDLNMPQMSGFELLSVVRRRFPQISVIATSGAYESSGVPSGVIADAFYPKGQESSEKLLEMIAELLRSGPIAHTGETAPVWILATVKTTTACLSSY